MFSLFVEKFETQAQELEKKASELILGIYQFPEPERKYDFYFDLI